MSPGEKPTLHAYCSAKASSVVEAEEKETWAFLALLLEVSCGASEIKYERYMNHIVSGTACESLAVMPQFYYLHEIL